MNEIGLLDIVIMGALLLFIVINYYYLTKDSNKDWKKWMY